MTFRTARRLSGLLALMATALAVHLGWRGSSRPNFFLHHSLPTFSAVAGLALLALASAWAFFLNYAHESAFRRLLARWRSLTPPVGPPTVCFLVVVVAPLLHAELARAQRPYKQDAAYVDDEADYLRVADEIRSLSGGVRGLLPALVGGEFAEDNRHPLYPALLAAGTQARIMDRPLLLIPTILSEAFGMAAVAATGVVAWKMFGPAVAALSATLVAVNGAMAQASSLVACETLLVLLTTLGWYVFASASTPMTWRRSLLAGILFGLAYLTKASALFPLLILIVLAAWKQGGRRRWLSPVVIALGFILVAWPLLTRNVVRYHNPLHSFNNKLLFAESYETGVAEPDLGTVGNLRRYLSRHTMKEVVVDRFLGGLLWEGFVLLRSLGPAPFDSGRVFVGLPLLLGALVGMGTALGGKLSPPFLLLWTACFLLFFGWYQPIASGDRFLLPLVPPLTIAASLGLVCVTRAVGRAPWNRS